MNENDPVPRADKPYILSIVDLYGRDDAGVEGDAQWCLPKPSLHIPKESQILALSVLSEEENGLQVCLNKTNSDEFEKSLSVDFERHMMKWYIAELEAWERAVNT